MSKGRKDLLHRFLRDAGAVSSQEWTVPNVAMTSTVNRTCVPLELKRIIISDA